MKSELIFATMAVLGVLHGSSAAEVANPRATFSGEGSKDSPQTDATDDFPGWIDGGWNGSWEILEQNSGQVNLVVEIVGDNPLSAEGGNRLQISYERLGGSGANRVGVMREFANDPNSGGIDPLKPYKVKFQFRLDGMSGTFDDAHDQFTFAGSSAISKEGLGDKELWAVLYRGQSADGKSTGGWTAWHPGGKGEIELVRFGNSTIAIDLNKVIDVTVSVDPQARTWDVEVTADGSNFRASDARAGEPLRLRSAATIDAATFLSFRSSRTGRGKTMTWSLDNVEVVQD